MKNLLLKQTLLAFTLPWRLVRNHSTTTTRTAAGVERAAIMADQTEAITLSNYETLLPPFDPNGSGLFGLVDMGSYASLLLLVYSHLPNIQHITDLKRNGIRFTISDLSPPRSRLLPAIYRERAGISLYDALHSGKPDDVEFQFSQSTIKLVSQTLARFARICQQYRVPPAQISVFATEAMRTAHNQAEMLNSIKNATGLNVQILSPAMESMFGAMGARSAFGDVKGLFMDLGGGSVQMTYLNSKKEGYEVEAAVAAKSIPAGAAKLTATLQTTSAEDVHADLKTIMAETFRGMCEKFPDRKSVV